MPNNDECPIDFVDMYKVAEEIARWTKEVDLLEMQLKLAESEITRIATTDEKYLVNGKRPAQTTIDKLYYGGFGGSLISKREELAEAKYKLIYAKGKLDVMKAQLDVWRTQSANERKLVM